MGLRRDEKGRPVGLAWPEAPEFTPEQIKRTLRSSSNQLANLEQGRVRSDLCGKGLHDMSVYGREIKSGGRYCSACKSEAQKKWRAANPESVKKSREKYNASRNVREQAS